MDDDGGVNEGGYSHSRGEGGSCLMAVRGLRPIKELGFGRQEQITANRTIRQDPPSVGERLYWGSGVNFWLAFLMHFEFSGPGLGESKIPDCMQVCIGPP
ncbi:hypothetical protein P167DRAFT_537442 [Morchella conica CCBAS932]|uniref:Uncharacterized protein n=1 Tax=Morchella conica CCBAS932 TaxID=1392247 RepID=A0A3N4KM78_9PEZI|nr:hypothetical protein P167DRAFT_537442 [Morchella conica CCBAS932]